jgi:hypothetical protein
MVNVSHTWKSPKTMARNVACEGWSSMYLQAAHMSQPAIEQSSLPQKGKLQRGCARLLDCLAHSSREVKRSCGPDHVPAAGSMHASDSCTQVQGHPA